MLADTTQLLFFIILAIFIGIFIGYFLAKIPEDSIEEDDLNTDMHVDAATGIVSDDSLLNRGKH